jgi:crotonobetainyl-CoA:carnitine CoA-transferase CaiB-like acyl-CoA transferase
VRTSGPALGEHNEEVWKGLVGVSDDRYDALVAAGTI